MILSSAFFRFNIQVRKTLKNYNIQMLLAAVVKSKTRKLKRKIKFLTFFAIFSACLHRLSRRLPNWKVPNLKVVQPSSQLSRRCPPRPLRVKFFHLP